MRKAEDALESSLAQIVSGAPVQVGPNSHAVERDGWLFSMRQLATDRLRVPDAIEAPPA